MVSLKSKVNNRYFLILLLYYFFTKVNAISKNFGIINNMKMNIFKSFELFLREPLSIIKERIIQIVGVNFTVSTESSLSVDMLNRKTQITVVNSDKMYNLLRTVSLKKEKIQEERAVQRLLSATDKKQIVIGQLCKRQ